MFEGNISGLLGMSNKNDGTGGYSGSKQGSYSQRLRNRDNHYYRNVHNVDPETGEVLDFKPKNVRNPYSNMQNYAKRSGANFNAIANKLPKPKQLFDIAILGALAYGGYIIYKKFLSPLTNSALDDAKDKSDANIAKNYVNSTNAAATVNSATATSLGNSGFQINSTHKTTAVLLHNLMNAVWVDHDEIVKVIKGMSLPTLQLVSAAYGVQDLPVYRNSLTHVFDSDTWTDLFSGDKMLGTLKFHLTKVLTSSELKSISSWTNSIA